jgi:phenolic acid decarboxylase
MGECFDSFPLDKFSFAACVVHYYQDEHISLNHKMRMISRLYSKYIVDVLNPTFSRDAL